MLVKSTTGIILRSIQLTNLQLGDLGGGRLKLDMSDAPAVCVGGVNLQVDAATRLKTADREQRVAR
jgi:hypothetical protein